MKQLFSTFPLLKKKRFYLCLALILLFCFLSGFLYIDEERERPLSFEEEKDAIEAALDIAEQNLAACEEDDKSRFLQEKAYYESALKFRLSPWGSEFAYEGLSLYATLSLKSGTEEALAELETILAERDAEGLYKLCKADPDLPQLDLRRLSAEASPSPGKSALLYDIFLLEESLSSGKDLYFAKERALTPGDKALFQNLLKYKENALETDGYDPVPLNSMTLLNTEQFIACLLTVLLLGVIGFRAGQATEERLWLFALPLAGSVFFCAVALFCSVLLFAPETAVAAPMLWGDTLPFFPALFCRLFCRVLGSLPLMLLCRALSRKRVDGTVWKLSSFSPLLRLIFSTPLTLSGIAPWGTLSLCIFPNLTAGAVRNPMPWGGALLWLVALALSVWLLVKKQKITLENQELSLEKNREL